MSEFLWKLNTLVLTWDNLYPFEDQMLHSHLNPPSKIISIYVSNHTKVKLWLCMHWLNSLKTAQIGMKSKASCQIVFRRLCDLLKSANVCFHAVFSCNIFRPVFKILEKNIQHRGKETCLADSMLLTPRSSLWFQKMLEQEVHTRPNLQRVEQPRD